VKLVLHDGEQGRKVLLNGDPNAALPHVLVIVPVDASSSGDVRPRKFQDASPSSQRAIVATLRR
jgi:hypothetical protein